MEKIIEFANAARLAECSSCYSQLDGSYLFGHITPGSGNLAALLGNQPLKLGGQFMMLMRKGSPIVIEINQERVELKPGMFMAAFPGNVVEIKSPIRNDAEIYTMFFDMKFLQGVNISMTSIAIPPMIKRIEPAQLLNEDECDLLCRYFELLYINTKDGTNTQISKTLASSLIAAMFYQLVQFYHRRLTDVIDAADKPNAPSRRHDYVREFVRLVHLHYTRERSVSFYADRLFISPKYLSLLVKEATGRTAAKWIDDFVLMEAKNMLRFSGKNIQQVAYALNFPTQSSFGKYFKHLTGMSPTEYQKS